MRRVDACDAISVQGYEWQTLHAMNSEWCCSECAAHALCIGWQFDATEQRCSLATSDMHEGSSNNLIATDAVMCKCHHRRTKWI